MTDPFADPGSSTAVEFQPLLGSLLLFTVHSIERDIVTVHGTTDAIRADIDVLDGKHANEKYADALVFSKMLQSQLRGRLGQKVLGRLQQGEAKRGQNPPWQLAAATDQDRDAGRAFLSGQMSSAPAPSGDQPPF